MKSLRTRPEVLAPAGDRAALEAAMRAGADAVYFGLAQFNARARAANFDEASLAEILASLHARGVKGYVTLNTLVFDHELGAMESAIRACARAGVDAVIVQDLGVLAMARAIAPELRLHASTQMTCTDAESVLFAKDRGVSRVVLARELGLTEIAAIQRACEREGGMELEVFVHGALCIAYSGQCLTSEAIGGRSANRGACAQACRLPYTLVVDGKRRPLDDRAYLLSPEDLEASALVPELADVGVSSLKIEGRLKGPAYVASTTRLYRAAIDGMDDDALGALRAEALQTYSRGSGPGFLAGIDHQRLVEARGCDHRGLVVGRVAAIEHDARRAMIVIEGTETRLARGDGLLVEGALGGEGELGGRVWNVETRARGERGARDVEHAGEGSVVRVWLGPDRTPDASLVGRRVFKNDDPLLEKAVITRLDRDPHREPIAITISGEIGGSFTLRAQSRRGLVAEVVGDALVDRAKKLPTPDATIRESMERLGETTFLLDSLTIDLPEDRFLPVSSLHRARRALTDALTKAASRSIATSSITASELVDRARPPERDAPSGGLFVLCRNVAQARAAIAAGADGVYLDFLEVTGTGQAVRALRSEGARFVGVAPPRIRKPGEEKIQGYLDSLAPDAVLVRGLGHLREVGRARAGRSSGSPCFVGDFSLNVTNRISAREILEAGLDAFVPSFDLDATQLLALLDSPFGPWAELVVHHPMPLFHMEHCVIAALLSEGRDHKTCGRPCEKHVVGLQDRAGMEHPVEADVGCRNTVFHAHAQSAASQVPRAMGVGVRRFRVELVRETEVEVERIVRSYSALLRGESTPSELLRAVRAEGHYGVVRGSLRVLST
ncbi:MAG: U32 family peptidase [Deltaproteobacteria bacterium]|nr:U32 family peptidase [Deltaproteobacteria bacterium]